MIRTGLLGHPLGHTLSPRMHAVAFQYAGIDGLYLPFDIPPKHLAAALEGLPVLGWRGCNVTIPHKQSVLRYVDRPSPAVVAIGAANTLTFDHGQIRADNTDVTGFLEAWDAEVGTPLSQTRVALLGCGGAARAILYGLMSRGVGQVDVYSRNPRAVARLGATSCGWPAELSLARYTALINTTPVGMLGHAAESPVRLFGDLTDKIVWDAIYNPSVTPLMETASKLGARTFNGLHMLAAQAAGAFRMWTGREVPATIFKNACS